MDNFFIKRQDVDPEVKRILKRRRKLTDEQIDKVFVYNIITINQFRDLTGLTPSNISYHSTPRHIKGDMKSNLDILFPFPDNTGQGLKFIIVNEKFIDFIRYKI